MSGFRQIFLNIYFNNEIIIRKKKIDKEENRMNSIKVEKHFKVYKKKLLVKKRTIINFFLSRDTYYDNNIIINIYRKILVKVYKKKYFE